VTFSHNGKWIATSSFDETVRIWNVETAELQRLFKGSTYCYTLAFSPSDKLLASGGSEEDIRIWDCETGELERLIHCLTGWHTAMAFSHDGRRLAYNTVSGDIQIWDLETGVLQKFPVNGASLSTLSFGPGGSGITTNLGYITLDQAPPLHSGFLSWLGYSVDTSGSWITWNGKRVLWLPPEYRPSDSVVREQTMAFRCISNQLLLFRFHQGSPVL
jgi:WD40 repeat protein